MHPPTNFEGVPTVQSAMGVCSRCAACSTERCSRGKPKERACSPCLSSAGKIICREPKAEATREITGWRPFFGLVFKRQARGKRGGGGRHVPWTSILKPRTLSKPMPLKRKWSPTKTILSVHHTRPDKDTILFEEPSCWCSVPPSGSWDLQNPIPRIKTGHMSRRRCSDHCHCAHFSQALLAAL